MPQKLSLDRFGNYVDTFGKPVDMSSLTPLRTVPRRVDTCGRCSWLGAEDTKSIESIAGSNGGYYLPAGDHFKVFSGDHKALLAYRRIRSWFTERFREAIRPY